MEHVLKRVDILDQHGIGMGVVNFRVLLNEEGEYLLIEVEPLILNDAVLFRWLQEQIRIASVQAFVVQSPIAFLVELSLGLCFGHIAIITESVLVIGVREHQVEQEHLLLKWVLFLFVYLAFQVRLLVAYGEFDQSSLQNEQPNIAEVEMQD